MSKILLTGSNGLLGQKIMASLLLRSDVEFIATSRGENRYPVRSGYPYESLDVTDFKQLEKVILKHRPSSVIHTAAMTHVDLCEKEQSACWKLNVEAVEHLGKICCDHDIHVVHLSTDFVFDGKNPPGPYKEDASPHPQSYYAKSKLASEEALQKIGGRGAILRTILLYGVTADLSRSNVVLWAKESLEKKQEIKAVIDQVRMPTLAEDLAEACISAAMKEASGIYHVSGKDAMSIFELVHKVADFLGLDASKVKATTADVLNLPAKRPAVTGFILDKALRELDYRPHSFEEGLAIVKKQLAKQF